MSQPTESERPARAKAVLAALILVAAVANLNLAVANVALPDIGKAFDAGQVSLNLVAVGYSLGLAGSVLYLGALGDRYGRKTMLLLGTGLAIPASVLAGVAPSIEFAGAGDEKRTPASENRWTLRSSSSRLETLKARWSRPGAVSSKRSAVRDRCWVRPRRARR